jgi:hypothetical protein
MFADIISGHPLLSEWLFLIAVVLAVIGAVAAAPKVITPKLGGWAITLAVVAIGLIAAAFLVL